MRQLIYSSRWTEQAARDPALVLQQIIGQSIQNNRVVNVTGLLIAQDGLFIQLLEGPAGSVGERIKRIAADARHRDVRLISDIETDQRMFRHWTMAGVRTMDEAPDAAGLDAGSARALLLRAGALEQERERRLIFRAA